VLATLKHKNIVTYKDHFVQRDKNLLIIVMNYYPSKYPISNHFIEGDLAKNIEKNRMKNKAFSEETVTKWFDQLCSALIYLDSKGIIHRDLKPQNILLNGANSVVIGDLGISKILGTNTSIPGHYGTGTSCYKAPEIWNGQ